MRVKMTLNIVGIRYYDITDEKTGEIKRYTSIFTLQPSEFDKPDRTGFEPGKVRCADSSVVSQLKTVKLPAEIECDCELNVNGKGEARVMVHAVNLSASKLKAA